MPSMTSAPSSVVSAGNWTGVANTYASDNAYATYTLAATNTDYPFEVGGFDFSTVPADAIIESVTVLVENKTSSASSNTMTAQLFDGVTAIGAATSLTLGTADTDRTFVVTGVTRAQLVSANLKVQVVGRKSTSQARTQSVDRVSLTAAYVVPGAKVATYTDNFAGDLSKWTYGNVTLDTGRASLNVTSGVYAYLDTTPFARLDFRASSLYGQWTLPTMAGTNECFLQVNYDTANYISAFRSGDASTLYLRVRKAGVNTTTSGTFTDNWWRLRESGGTVYLDTSPDGTTWTQRLSLVHGLSDALLAQVYIEATAGDYGTAGAKAFYLDNINTVPSSAPTGSGSGSWAVAGSATGSKVQSGSGSGAWGVAGSSTGTTTRSGSGSGAWEVAGSGAGSKAPAGSGEGSWGVSGSATGVSSRAGTGAGGWEVSGSATGQAPALGTSSGSAAFGWAVAGQAAGSTDPKGSALGGWEIVGEASGAAARGGTASGAWSVGGSAAGFLLVRDLELVAELLRDRFYSRLMPERAEASLVGTPIRASLTEHPVTARMEVESWHGQIA